MPDNNKNELEAEFAFLVIKSKDGRISIGNLDDAKTERQPTIDDIYASIAIVQRDIQANQIAGTMVGVLQQVGAPEQTQSGIVVPAPSGKFTKTKRVK